MNEKKTRREFLELGLKASVVIPFLAAGLSSCTGESGNKKLKILILGGTSFLGPHQIAYALERGHSITTFTRGRTKSTIYKEKFAQVEQLVGDRKDNLSALKNRKWDAVIDNSGRKAEWTKRSAALLKENCDLYLYTSSTGVFYPYINSAFKEDSKVVLAVPPELDDPELEIEYGYGVMKANSELEAIKEFGADRTIVVRPTYMIGPADKSNRFIHWPIRLNRGGEVLVPGKAEDRVQYVDVRDVAEWMIRLLEDKKAGTYNAAGPIGNQTMDEFVEEAQKAFEAKSSIVKVDDYEFLQENKVPHIVPWIMPTENNAGSAKINNQKAVANGLTFRPLVDSVKNTFAWWNSEAVTQKQRDNLENDPRSVLGREQELIAKWKAR